MIHSHEENVLATIRRLKEGPLLREPWLPVGLQGRTVAWLEPVTWLDAERDESIHLLTHDTAPDGSSSSLPTSAAETRRWLIRQLLQVSDRLLFWITGLEGTRVGHVGLHRFNFTGREVEVENLVRRSPGALPGVMAAGTRTLLAWAFGTLQMESVSGQVLAANEAALRLAQRCGFRENARTAVAGGCWVTLRLLRAEWDAANHRGDVAA